MRVNLPKVFSQFDDPWAKQLLGFNTDPKYNFYNFGCTTTCLAEVACYFGHDEHPLSFMQKLMALGESQGYVKGTGLYVHGAISKLFPDIVERVVRTPNKLTDAEMNEIKAALDAHAPVMVRLDYNPKTIERENHFVLITDYNPKDENDFTIVDSLGGKTHSMKNYLGLFKRSVRDTIEEYFIFTGPIAQTPTPPEPSAPIQEAPSEPAPAPKPEVPTPSGVLPPNYADIIHDATEWGLTTKYLELPRSASFEEVKRIIAGLKSAKTDYDNKRIAAEQASLRKDNEIEVLKEQVSSLTRQAAQDKKIHNAEILSLKQNQPSFDKMRGEYEAALTEERGKNVENLDVIKQLKGAISDAQVEVVAKDDTVSFHAKGDLVEKLVSLLKKPIELRW